jgi:hypothetical protein
MSKNIIIVLIYNRHKLLGLIYICRDYTKGTHTNRSRASYYLISETTRQVSITFDIENLHYKFGRI